VRDEDELRAAFQQKAAEAPRAADVLRAVRAREAVPPARRRRWLMPAVAGAAAIAVGVPLGIALSHSSSSEKNKSAGAAHEQTTAASGRGAERAGAGPQNAPEAAAARICSQADVTVSVQGDTLRITSRGAACQLIRVPSVRVGAAPSATPTASAREFATLVPRTTATAPLHWTGSCATRTGGVIRVDWGAGPVEVHAARVPNASCGAASVGPLQGLH
jgi:hypothetical protein